MALGSRSGLGSGAGNRKLKPTTWPKSRWMKRRKSDRERHWRWIVKRLYLLILVVISLDFLILVVTGSIYLLHACLRKSRYTPASVILLSRLLRRLYLTGGTYYLLSSPTHERITVERSVLSRSGFLERHTFLAFTLHIIVILDVERHWDLNSRNGYAIYVASCADY